MQPGSLQKEEISTQTHTEGRQCEDSGGGCPSTAKEKASEETNSANTLILDF